MEALFLLTPPEKLEIRKEQTPRIRSKEIYCRSLKEFDEHCDTKLNVFAVFQVLLEYIGIEFSKQKFTYLIMLYFIILVTWLQFETIEQRMFGTEVEEGF